MEIRSIQEETMSIATGTQTFRSGHFYTAGQEDENKFTPIVRGFHRFEMADLPSGYAVGLYVYNEIDHRIARSTATRSGQGLSLNLAAGENTLC